jgi:hypothetical protein
MTAALLCVLGILVGSWGIAYVDEIERRNHDQ